MRPAVLALFFYCLGPAAGAQTSSSAAGTTTPTYKLEGVAALMSNYVDYGVTHTAKDPALQGSFLFNWGPQFRLGLWGSNVSYETDAHFLLKLSAELRIEFSPNANVAIRLADNQYFKKETRNGPTTGLHLTLFEYRVTFEQLTNFLGTESGASYYGFGKTWTVFQTWKWANQIGYLAPGAPTLSGYFDLRSMIGTKPENIDYQIGATFNSSPAQFNGAGDPFLILSAAVSF